jgi:hypothetical protein
MKLDGLGSTSESLWFSSGTRSGSGGGVGD